MQVLIVTQLKDAQNNDTQDVSKVHSAEKKKGRQ